MVDVRLPLSYAMMTAISQHFTLSVPTLVIFMFIFSGDLLRVLAVAVLVLSRGIACIKINSRINRKPFNVSVSSIYCQSRIATDCS